MVLGSLSSVLRRRSCELVWLVCFLQVSVILFYSHRSLYPPWGQNQQDDPSIQNQQDDPSIQNQQENTAKRNQDRPADPPRGEEAGEPGDKGQNPGGEAVGPGGKELQQCPGTAPLLVGPLRVEFSSPVKEELIKKENPALQPGGRFRPRDCVAQQKVAIIIPFRNREEHLKFWLYYLHPILQRQQLDYGVYVVNQDGEGTFNRAKLMNVGYAEALKDYDYDCFVFSDVDLIPMDDRNTYRCFSQPRHLSVSVDKFGFRLPYAQCFGGVSSMSKEQFLKINGFPNNYWGWGGEDDDIFRRFSYKGMSISRPSGEIGKYRMIRHNRDKKNEPNPQRFGQIAHTLETMSSDGISSLSYSLVKKEKLDLYTRIHVDVGGP
ncbi:LOW QUALITY PROTEIN: beta-1,4-galactosyltransferase 1-like [Trematomus bernacchii]|uniref:LOW QUALITY PROTEIN: beta-1,4-galactosyltransferase 1-like n=1 Tax=Trematomus bernacchii TaxID=40690 RepID=UPI00146E6D19|nr:LOW QUALITY PROTEIN: beta-1,4-galactosyltransferase 1-like [Trematomus bernacchii]